MLPRSVTEETKNIKNAEDIIGIKKAKGAVFTASFLFLNICLYLRNFVLTYISRPGIIVLRNYVILN